MKIKVWLDSGANHQSCREEVVDLEEDLGITEAEWAAMSDDEKEETMRDVAFANSEWGFTELTEGET